MKKYLQDKKFSSVIIVNNLSIPQSIALEDMLATWQSLGSAGASRWTSYFADGDGNFRPKILYNGHPPRKTELLEEEETWKGSEYRIDFDSIGWKLHDHENIREIEAKNFNIFKVLFGTIRLSIVYAVKEIVLQIKSHNIRKRHKKCEKVTPTQEESYESSESPNKACDSI